MKKILFNDKYCLTQAVLEGRKTTTRRIVTDKKLHYWKCSCPDMVIVRVPESQKLKTDDDNTYFGIKDKMPSEYYCDTITSPYKVGEVVSIAQSYKDLGYDAEEPLQEDVGYYPHIKNAAGWNNKMFVRSEACKHHIRITNVKIEHIQDISDEECLREGVVFSKERYEYDGTKSYFVQGIARTGSRWNRMFCKHFDTPRQAFAALIDKVSGKGTWSSNPFVFVYEFELVD